MNEVTRILSAVENGEPQAAEQLLPLVYDELRRLAAQRLAREKPGQTLQATALVHEAYVRLVDTDRAQHWNSRGHFFAAAAEAMRRILIEQVRRKRSQRRGGARVRCDLGDDDLLNGGHPFDAARSRRRRGGGGRLARGPTQRLGEGRFLSRLRFGRAGSAP